MAITLTPNTVNLFTANTDTDVIGANQPSGSNGLEKISQGNETGFYLWTKQTVTIWFYYDNTGWQEHGTIQDSDEIFHDGFIEGGMIPWIDHENHGNVQKVYFQSSDNSAEVRLFTVIKNVQVDYIPGDTAFDRRFVSINGDTQIVGGVTNDKAGYVRVDHDLENYNPGDTYSTAITIGDSDAVISLMDRFKNLNSTWSYDVNTGETSISFIVPDVKNERSIFHSYVSLTTIQQGSGGTADPIQGIHTGMSITVRVGNLDYGSGSLGIALPTKGSFKVDWGDGSTDDFVNSVDWARHTYASAGDYQIKIADSTDFKWRSAFGINNPFPYFMTGGAGLNNGKYVLADDTNNDGPIVLGKHWEGIDNSTIDSWTTSGSVMTIVDNTGFRWDEFFTGANRAGVQKVSMVVNGVGANEFAPVQSASYNGATKTSTITLAYGKPAWNNGDKLMEDYDLANENLNFTRVYYGPDLNNYPVWVRNDVWDRVENMPRNYSKDHEKFISIDQWGDLEWSESKGAFTDYTNLDITATDSPNWTDCVSLLETFKNCSSLTDVNNSLNSETVCHSGMTSLYETFMGCSSYNGNLNNWDVSGVKSFVRTFRSCTIFNGDIANWVLNKEYLTSLNTNHMIKMPAMFYDCHAFNRNINTKVRSDGQIAWDTECVQQIHYMFRNAYTFNQPISNWNTSNMTHIYGLFRGEGYVMAYNQYMNTDMVTVGSNSYMAWDISGAESISYMFSGCQSFNQSLSNWDTSNSIGMGYMFWKAKSFNQDLICQQVTVGSNTYTAWDVSKMTTMIGTFIEAYKFNGLLSNWDTSSLNNMNSTFRYAYSFNQPLNHFNVSKVTIMKMLFRGAVSFNQPLSSWNVEQLDDASRVFEYAASFNQDLSSWGPSTGKIRLASRMFANMQSMTYGDFTSWNMGNATSIGAMFANDGLQKSYLELGAGQEVEQALGPHNFDQGIQMQVRGSNVYVSQINPNITGWNLEKCTSMNSTFRNQLPTWDQDFSTVSLSQGTLTDMSHTFAISDGFTGTGLNNVNFSNVTDMKMSFYMTAFNADVSSWDITNCTDFNQTFRRCTSFQGTGLNMWRPISATTFFYTFGDCGVLDADFSQWTITPVCTQLSYMFEGTNLLNSNFDANPNAGIQVNGQSYGTWDVSGVKYIVKFMKQDATGLFTGTLNNWDVSSVESLYLVVNAPLFQNNSLSTWKNVDKVISFMPQSGGSRVINSIDSSSYVGKYLLSVSDYDDILIGWATEIQNNGGTSLLGTGTNPSMDVNFVEAKYSTAAQSSRNYLTNTLGWNIQDGGLV